VAAPGRLEDREDGGDVARHDGKSADAFRTISEVADDVDVPQHVLRFWETKFPQIKPLKRGGGRRYYRPEDVDLIRKVRTWLYDDGYTIKGVQKLLREGAANVPDTEEQVPGEGEPTPGRSAPAGSSKSEDTVSTDAVVASLEAGEAELDDTARAAIGLAIGELERIRDRLRSPDK
jgi:DNA-binding transcriptional MerR regulator